MTAMSDTFTSNGTFTVPTNLIGQSVTCSALGASGGGGVDAAIVNANIPISLFPLLIWLGNNQSAGNGGNGYSGGGAGSTTAFGGNGGGGSTAVCSNTAMVASTGILLIEAAGSDGLNIVSGFVENGGGGGGGFAGSPGGQGVNGGNSAGGGGSQGGFGGGSSFGLNGGTAVGSQTLVFGGPGLTGVALEVIPGGSGGPSGGIFVADGVASSFAASTVVYLGVGLASGAGTGEVLFTWNEADAPNGPILNGPFSGQIVDGFNGGCEFAGTYEAPSADTGPLMAVTLHIVGGIIDVYFDGTGLSATPVWLIPTAGGGQTDGGQFSITMPPGILDNGVSWTYTMACQESFAGVKGPENLTPMPFSTAQSPTAIISAPIGEVASLTPTVSWTAIVSSGVQINYRFMVYDQPPTSPSFLIGADPPLPALVVPIYDSGVVVTAGNSFTLPSLTSGTVYYGFLLLTSTGDNPQFFWVPTTFTPLDVVYSAPTFAVALSADPTTGMPATEFTLTYPDNGVPVVDVQALWGSGQYGEILADWTSVGTTTATGYDLSSPFNTPVTYRARLIYPGGLYSAWTVTFNIVTVPSIYWWVIPPSSPLLAVQLFRLASSSSSSSGNDTKFSPTTPAMPGNLISSLTVDELEQLGTFHPFGKATATVVHGDIWSGEFDLSVYFQSTAAWNAFRTIRELQDVVLLKSDMEGDIYWVTMGGDLAPGIAGRSGRQQNPTRGLTVHCTPTDPPIL
jgi:hypothetical protein